MKILSWNVNGLRAVHKRGFRDWLLSSGAEIVCLQEVKIQNHQIPADLVNPPGYFAHLNTGLRKGYAGVAVYTKKQPKRIDVTLGHKRFDEEGRMIALDYPDWTIIALYLPHGGRTKENLPYKLEVYESLFKFLKTIKQKNLLLIGDFNIAHQDIDLARPNQNRDNIMFTPEERRQIDWVIELGFTDTFRQFHKDVGHYTWWPYMANARERNIGWRIDYAFVANAMASKIREAFTLPNVPGSDHCPIGLTLA